MIAKQWDNGVQAALLSGHIYIYCHELNVDVIAIDFL